MPTVLRLKGYRFFFYSNDHDPPLIHVEKGGATAKFNLQPVELLRSKNFNANEINELRKIVNVYSNYFKNKWYEHFAAK